MRVRIGSSTGVTVSTNAVLAVRLPSLTVTVTDGGGHTDSKLFSWTVN